MRIGRRWKLEPDATSHRRKSTCAVSLSEVSPRVDLILRASVCAGWLRPFEAGVGSSRIRTIPQSYCAEPGVQIRKGTNGVSTSRVTEDFKCFDRGTFGVLPLPYFHLPKSARKTRSPKLTPPHPADGPRIGNCVGYTIILCYAILYYTILYYTILWFNMI